MKVPLAERHRFPVQRSSEQGKSAPKARLKSVVDGKQVQIPVLFGAAMWRRRELDKRGVGCPRERV